MDDQANIARYIPKKFHELIDYTYDEPDFDNGKGRSFVHYFIVFKNGEHLEAVSLKDLKYRFNHLSQFVKLENVQETKRNGKMRRYSEGVSLNPKGLYKIEFPDFDAEFYCPAGFEDWSYHNDIMPHAGKRFNVGDKEIEIDIWQDYADEEKREYDNGKQYIFSIKVDDDVVDEYATDDLDQLKKYVADQDKLVQKALAGVSESKRKINLAVNKILEGADIRSTLCERVLDIELPKTSGSKYEFVSAETGYMGKTLYRIRALKSFGDVKKGDLGGRIEKEANLSQSGNCWVYCIPEEDSWGGYPDSLVCDSAKVDGDARVYVGAIIENNAHVFGNAVISGNATINGSSKVYGDAKIICDDPRGTLSVGGKSEIYDNAKISSGSNIWDSKVYGNAEVSSSYVHENSEVFGDACVDNKSKITGAKVGGTTEVHGGEVKSGEVVMSGVITTKADDNSVKKEKETFDASSVDEKYRKNFLKLEKLYNAIKGKKFASVKRKAFFSSTVEELVSMIQETYTEYQEEYNEVEGDTLSENDALNDVLVSVCKEVLKDPKLLSSDEWEDLDKTTEIPLWGQLEDWVYNMVC